MSCEGKVLGCHQAKGSHFEGNIEEYYRFLCVKKLHTTVYKTCELLKICTCTHFTRKEIIHKKLLHSVLSFAHLQFGNI